MVRSEKGFYFCLCIYIIPRLGFFFFLYHQLVSSINYVLVHFVQIIEGNEIIEVQLQLIVALGWESFPDNELVLVNLFEDARYIS